jgi:metallophosphoesterase (TIGR00282 family)
MNLLFIGDIFGQPARNAVKQLLPGLVGKEKIDLVVANGENLSAGIGMTFKNYHEMIESGIDYFTSGNHIWHKREFVDQLNNKNIKVLRPHNYPAGVPGRGVAEIEILGHKIVLVNLLGRVFLNNGVESPFVILDKIVKEHQNQTIIVDFHAEATSEKYALYKKFDGMVSAIIGTHTHVQTNDLQVSDIGTSYVSDVGMVGIFDSIIGAEKNLVIESFLTAMPVRIDVPKGEVIFNAVIVEIGLDNRAKSAKLVNKRVS